MRPVAIALGIAGLILFLNGALNALANNDTTCRPESSDKIGVTFSNGECHILPKKVIAR